jgi:hypothetical protein
MQASSPIDLYFRQNSMRTENSATPCRDGCPIQERIGFDCGLFLASKLPALNIAALRLQQLTLCLFYSLTNAEILIKQFAYYLDPS